MECGITVLGIFYIFNGCGAVDAGIQAVKKGNYKNEIILLRTLYYFILIPSYSCPPTTILNFCAVPIV